LVPCSQHSRACLVSAPQCTRILATVDAVLQPPSLSFVHLCCTLGAYTSYTVTYLLTLSGCQSHVLRGPAAVSKLVAVVNVELSTSSSLQSIMPAKHLRVLVSHGVLV
jgi:hypothetical protein